MNKENIIVGFSYFCGDVLNVYDIQYGINDYIIVGLNDEKPRKYKLYYSVKKGHYFNYHYNRIYMSEIFRKII